MTVTIGCGRSLNETTMKEKVELRPAYVWDCPDCGREIFHRGLVPEMTPEKEEELRDDFGVQPYEEGNFIMMPTRVKCPHCNESFPTLHFGDEDV